MIHIARKLSLKAMEEKAAEMCESLPESKQPRARELALNLLFIERKLDEARRAALTEPAVVEYDNGGGQTGTRVNPWVQAYGSLLKSYGAALRQLEDYFADVEAEAEKAESPLAACRGNFTANITAYRAAKSA